MLRPRACNQPGALRDQKAGGVAGQAGSAGAGGGREGRVQRSLGFLCRTPVREL